ncbi:hypothetical protein PtA15_6A477 [Puccinia triticina]|uniref:Uncharacterized protein n=1 Tax=Puccinia triticina TaxID=208348 RepID=A0ABY7CLP2_9BASI|nr:uncharacterized protein PtA15_6A477 [Puccinia triticina]WAQ85848.1 hypothetical protein PtA15_6A477 [Puccinia triticina]
MLGAILQRINPGAPTAGEAAPPIALSQADQVRIIEYLPAVKNPNAVNAWTVLVVEKDHNLFGSSPLSAVAGLPLSAQGQTADGARVVLPAFWPAPWATIPHCCAQCCSSWPQMASSPAPLAPPSIGLAYVLPDRNQPGIRRPGKRRWEAKLVSPEAAQMTP